MIGKMKLKKQIIYTLLMSLAIVLMWRGTWMLTDIYLIPSNKEISAWLSLIIGILLLAITQKHIKKDTDNS